MKSKASRQEGAVKNRTSEEKALERDKRAAKMEAFETFAFEIEEIITSLLPPEVDIE